MHSTVVFLLCHLVSVQFIKGIPAQLTSELDTTCLYSFRVPRDDSGQAGCGQGTSQQEQDMQTTKATIKQLQDQVTAMQQREAAAAQREAATAQREAALSEQLTAILKLTASTRVDMYSASNVTGGTVYVRWGRTVCEGDARVLYKGQAAGAFYSHTGSGSNYLCLHEDPQWANYVDGVQQYTGLIYGAEYELRADTGNPPFSTANNGGQALNDNDVPCAVCNVATRTAMIMIPARRECPSGWTKEYNGYLTSQASPSGFYRTEYVCMDDAPEVIQGGQANVNGVLFYPVQAMCGSLQCPKYVDGRELTCVVCTK